MILSVVYSNSMKNKQIDFVSIIAKIVFYGCLATIIFCFALNKFIKHTNFDFANGGDSFDIFTVFTVPGCILFTISGLFISQTPKINGWLGVRIVGTLILSFFVFLALMFSYALDLCVTSYGEPLFELKKDRSTKILEKDFGCGAYDSTPISASLVQIEDYPLGLIYITSRIDTNTIDKTKWIRIEP